MRLLSAKVKNFRLLSDIEFDFDEQTTLIVGRNNSGKTSLTEIIKRFLGDKSPSFQLEDFSLECYENFLDLFKNKDILQEKNKVEHNPDLQLELRNKLPAIELSLTIEYNKEIPNFGSLSPFIIDLDENCTKAIIIIRYELGKLNKDELNNLLSTDINLGDRTRFMQLLRNSIPKMFDTKVIAQDPNDPNNQKELTLSEVKKLIKVDFINAQRGLDDITTKESKPLAKLLESLFQSASEPNSNNRDTKSSTVKEIEEAIRNIQANLNNDITDKLNSLFPALNTFGYPGLGDQKFSAEITLEASKLD